MFHIAEFQELSRLPAFTAPAVSPANTSDKHIVILLEIDNLPPPADTDAEEGLSMAAASTQSESP